ncbi:MAG: conserved membrane protein of unknown function [Candidatus Thorarchaeota archaeon]|nr:MAG: conserved membrane protein of unknown function [Candidatus Thorarchaeota archaeon]
MNEEEQSLRRYAFPGFLVSICHRFKESSAITRLFISALIITTVSCVHYLTTMIAWTSPGFTLDDSWIHLQYARTIYQGIPWEYSPGHPSTGSTSPLWSVILSTLFFITQDPISLIYGTYLIAGLFYFLTTLLVGYIIFNYSERLLIAITGMVGFVIVPRTTWLMLSGMETPLFMFLLVFGVVLLDKKDIRYDPLLGITVGLAFLARPEGVILALFVPVRFFLLDREELTNWKRWVSFVLMAVIALLIVSPWIIHCLNTTGYPLPDTFYAKVHTPTEYEIDVWRFWWNIWLIEYPFILIGGILGLALVVNKKPFTWLIAVGLVLLYRLNLPYNALINNGRYLVPVFSFFFITAIVAIAKIAPYILEVDIGIKRPADRQLLTVFVILLVMIIPLLSEYLFQANLFGNSVKNINEQQVYIGKWLSENTPEDAVLAIHDAGAIRFFSNRSIIDLAGLVSPDIIHGNMSSIELLIYLREHGCEYFVFFNELMVYYSFLLGSGLEILLTVHLDDNVISGRDTMSVYYVNWSKVSILDSYTL